MMWRASWAGSRSGCPERCKTYPVRGLYRLADYPDHGALASILDRMGRARQAPETIPGEFMVVTGIPNHGKSVWVLNLLCNAPLCMAGSQHYSPRKCRPCPICATNCVASRAVRGRTLNAFIDEYFRFIDSDPTGREDEDFDLDWIIDKATDACCVMASAACDRSFGTRLNTRERAR